MKHMMQTVSAPIVGRNMTTVKIAYMMSVMFAYATPHLR